MCTNFGFNCHPDKPCALEQEWAALYRRRLLTYLTRVLRLADLSPFMDPTEKNRAEKLPAQN